MTKYLAVLSSCLFFVGVVADASAQSALDEDRKARMGLEKMVKMLELRRPQDKRKISTVLGKIADVDQRLAELIKPADMRSLRKQHQGKGPCFRYDHFPKVGPEQVKKLTKQYDADFIELNLGQLQQRIEQREQQAHGKSIFEEYKDLAERLADQRREEGESGYYVGLVERRHELYDSIVSSATLPELKEDRIKILDQLIDQHPQAVSGENMIQTLLFTRQFLSRSKGRRLLPALKQYFAKKKRCPSSLDSFLSKKELQNGAGEDGWHSPYLVQALPAKAGCRLVSLGKDGTMGGSGFDAELYLK